MDRHPVRAYLERIPVNQLVVRLALLRRLSEDLNRFHNLASFERSLDRTLSAHYTVYFERLFTTEQLRDIPRYLVYRYLAFGTPLSSTPKGTYSSSTSGDESPRRA